MLRQVAEGLLIHQSEFCQSNAVVVQGRAGVGWPSSRDYRASSACPAPCGNRKTCGVMFSNGQARPRTKQK